MRFKALAASVAGAVGSSAFMLYAGRRNDSKLLLFLMAIWVISPFLILWCTSLFSEQWQAVNQMKFHWMMIAITLLALTVYSIDSMRPPHAQAAFVYIVVPPVLWLLMAAAFLGDFC